jgi:two-component system, response regulator PdtaR
MGYVAEANKLLVLIVEDDRLLRMDALDMIEEAGFDVLEAGDADEAIAILEARLDVRAIFTDIDMPTGSIDGLQLAHDVHDRWPGMVIIITSGQAAIPEKDLPTGGKFFTKPYSFRQVTDTIRTLSN